MSWSPMPSSMPFPTGALVTFALVSRRSATRRGLPWRMMASVWSAARKLRPEWDRSSCAVWRTSSAEISRCSPLRTARRFACRSPVTPRRHARHRPNRRRGYCTEATGRRQRRAPLFRSRRREAARSSLVKANGILLEPFGGGGTRPGPVIDRAHPPQSGDARWVQIVEARDRAVVDGKAERGLGRHGQCQRQRGSNGPTVRYRDDVAAAILSRCALDRRHDARNEIGKAFPTDGPLLRGGKPQGMGPDLARGIEGLALLPLPFAQMLLGQGRHLDRRDAGEAVGSRSQDRRGGLFGAQQVAGQPDRLARQLARKNAEDLRIAAVTGQVALAIDKSAIGHRRMPDPPPSRLLRHGAQSIVTTILPMALRSASRAMASPARAKG